MALRDYFRQGLEETLGIADVLRVRDREAQQLGQAMKQHYINKAKKAASRKKMLGMALGAGATLLTGGLSGVLGAGALGAGGAGAASGAAAAGAGAAGAAGAGGAAATGGGFLGSLLGGSGASTLGRALTGAQLGGQIGSGDYMGAATSALGNIEAGKLAKAKLKLAEDAKKQQDFENSLKAAKVYYETGQQYPGYEMGQRYPGTPGINPNAPLVGDTGRAALGVSDALPRGGEVEEEEVITTAAKRILSPKAQQDLYMAREKELIKQTYKKEEDKKFERRSATSLISNNKRVIKDIDSLLKDNKYESGVGWQYPLALIPGTKARNVASDIDTLVANQAFQTLQAMRDASKTGGALGQISERELDLLSATVASLDRGQKDENFGKNLRKFKNQLKNINEQVEKKYNTTEEQQEAEAEEITGERSSGSSSTNARWRQAAEEADK